MNELLREYLPVLIFIVVAAGLSGIMVTASLVLARQKPAWRPGMKHGYHTLTLGWYQSELIRRVDPQRRSLGALCCFAVDLVQIESKQRS